MIIRSVDMRLCVCDNMCMKQTGSSERGRMADGGGLQREGGEIEWQ
jgi:hypothetical protein